LSKITCPEWKILNRTNTLCSISHLKQQPANITFLSIVLVSRIFPWMLWELAKNADSLALQKTYLSKLSTARDLTNSQIILRTVPVNTQ
jgi:hypothetical protein